jgi:hypothetical protein
MIRNVGCLVRMAIQGLWEERWGGFTPTYLGTIVLSPVEAAMSVFEA